MEATGVAIADDMAQFMQVDSTFTKMGTNYEWEKFYEMSFITDTGYETIAKSANPLSGNIAWNVFL